MKCSICGCRQPVENQTLLHHITLLDCSIALASARGAVEEVIDRIALKLGEKHIKEYAIANNLTDLLKQWF